MHHVDTCRADDPQHEDNKEIGPDQPLINHWIYSPISFTEQVCNTAEQSLKHLFLSREELFSFDYI